MFVLVALSTGENNSRSTITSWHDMILRRISRMGPRAVRSHGETTIRTRGSVASFHNVTGSVLNVRNPRESSVFIVSKTNFGLTRHSFDTPKIESMCLN